MSNNYDNMTRQRKLGCGYVCLRKFVNLFNIIFVLIGFVMIGVGVYLHMSELSAWYGKSMPVILWVTGGFIVGLAGMGVCGACSENKCLLWLYSFILMVMIIAQVAVVVIGLTQSGVFETYLQKAWNELEDDCANMDFALNQDDDNADYDDAGGDAYGASDDADANDSQYDDKQDGAVDDAYDVDDVDDVDDSQANDVDDSQANDDPERRRLQDDPDEGCIVYAIEQQLECCCFEQCDPDDEDLPEVDQYCLTQFGEDAPGCYEQAEAEIQGNYTLAIGIAGGVGGLQVLLFLATCCLMNGISAKEERERLKGDGHNNYGQYGAAV